MGRTLLITPPLLQPNSPYPATAYLKSFLNGRGHEAEQFDLSVELLNRIFSSRFLSELFASITEVSDETEVRTDENDDILDTDTNTERIYALRKEYINTIDPVMAFLRGNDPALAYTICRGGFLPEADRFENTGNPDEEFGWMGIQDCAKHLCTLYLQDISDFIRATVSEHFEIVKYAERLSVSTPDFSVHEAELSRSLNIIEEHMLGILKERLDSYRPDNIAFTVPFPGNLLSSLQCGKFIKENYPGIKVIIGGGYPTTELRQMADTNIFRYIDYIVLDDGEMSLLNIVENNGSLKGVITVNGYQGKGSRISHKERGCPDFSGLAHDKYFSLCEVTNPMHRLWSDGRWNKMMLAHGCYWAKCAFCDTSLDYIKCYDTVSASEIVDWMERVAAQTGSTGFHFVDEAAPPKLLRDISVELLRRGCKYTWWTNIRFEKAFTGDLCRLMASAGCIAVSGGLEVASDRLLEMIGKGITVEQAAITMRNFFYAGIMVHSYLMYGLPTQTLQETVDALEVVRQLFRAQLINSAFWHRYAMTIHSDSGINPEKYGVRCKSTILNPFANNEIPFTDNRGYNIAMAGETLQLSLANYMSGMGIDKPVHKWFSGKAPRTTVENTLITDHLIKPDSSRIFDEKARLIWIGISMERVEDGILVRSKEEDKHIKFPDHDADFFVRVADICKKLDTVFTFEDAKQLYLEFSDEPFVILYHSKKWDMLRKYGLLQI